MTDAAMSVLVTEKTTSLSERFSIKLKFNIDTFVKWFNSTFKVKHLELNDIRKQMFVKEYPLDFSKTICWIFGFKLSVSDREVPEKNP